MKKYIAIFLLTAFVIAISSSCKSAKHQHGQARGWMGGIKKK
jgi:hypothetical protein